MILTVKYFYENDDENYDKYNKLWNENKHRIIHLHTDLSLQKRIYTLNEEIKINFEKDILAIRFPLFSFCNYIIKQIQKNNGIKYDHNSNLWCPNEIWIYNPK